MITTKPSINNCPNCGGELKVKSVDYFGKSGIIILAILGGIVTVLFCYTVIITSNGGNWGKLLVFGTVAIFTLIYKIGNKQQEILTCPNCEPSNTSSRTRRAD